MKELLLTGIVMLGGFGTGAGIGSQLPQLKQLKSKPIKQVKRGTRTIPVLKVQGLPKNVIRVSKPILQQEGIRITNRLLEVANNLNKKQPLYMLINSPGGDLQVGTVIISTMQMIQSRGIKIICISTIQAHSMAFILFSYCSKRYSLTNTGFLIHQARASVPTNMIMTAKDLRMQASQLDKINRKILSGIIAKSKMPKKMLTEGFYNEKLWLAKDLTKYAEYGWITIVKDIQNLTQLFEFKLNATRPKYYNRTIEGKK